MELGSESAAIVPSKTFGDSLYVYRYNNNDHIGTGANGTVFQATVTKGRDFLKVEHVAVKVTRFDEELVTDGVKWNKLCERLQELPKFVHDNLVRYHQISIAKGLSGGASIELMMDYHDSDLRKLIRNLRQQKVLLSEAAAVSYTIQIAEGLQFLHDKRIIHGDLKPTNILTRQFPNGDRNLVISDLDDIVQMERDATCSHDISGHRGTTRYMSPEMLKKFVAVQNMQESETPGRQTDIWSLGCIMLELADCVVGNDRKWLHKGLEKTEIDDRISDQKFVSLIIEGYVPFVTHTIPSYITANLEQCLRAAGANRVSARRLVELFKLTEPAMVPRGNNPFGKNGRFVFPCNGPFFHEEIFGCSTCQYQCNYSDFIGKAAVGTVYQATITNHGCTNDFLGAELVAVKVIYFDSHSGLLTARDKWGRLRQTLKNLIQFSHEHLVRYHKITIARGSLGGASVELMMDYHTGGDLRVLIRNLRQEKSLMSEAVAVSYTIQIAEGLRYLHDRQIIHGDLKPSTILTTNCQNGDQKLAICGLDDIVEMERDTTCSQDIHLRGTYRYMSPEKLKKLVESFTRLTVHNKQGMEESSVPGRKTDIWSLGCIMVDLADCVVGNEQKWLRKGHVEIEVGNKVNDDTFVRLITEGYVPCAIPNIPSSI